VEPPPPPPPQEARISVTKQDISNRIKHLTFLTFTEKTFSTPDHIPNASLSTT
jgi:hypothetical protein